MKIEHFKMERMQSTWENVVEYNLSESGVHPLTLGELVPQDRLEGILQTNLGYLQTNGTPELRETISGMYPGTTADNILVTSGSAEANFLLMWSLIEPGDEVLLMLPNYMQMWGLMRGFGACLKPFFLREDLDWNPDPRELESLVTKSTKLIAVTNPNNPTGAQLSPESMQILVKLAEQAGAWLIADEIYQGAEQDGQLTPSFWGTIPRVIVTSGLSKAYGLPGLRAGWIVAPVDLIQHIWPYHDYTTICISAVSDRLARIALTPETRAKILDRTRQIVRTNFALLHDWMDEQEGVFHCIPPKAGAIAFARYNLPINSTVLIDRIREKKSVLLVPGDHFEMDHHIRFGFGEEKERLQRALSSVREVLKEMKTSPTG